MDNGRPPRTVRDEEKGWRVVDLFVKTIPLPMDGMGRESKENQVHPLEGDYTVSRVPPTFFRMHVSPPPLVKGRGGRAFTFDGFESLGRQLKVARFPLLPWPRAENTFSVNEHLLLFRSLTLFERREGKKERTGEKV